MRHTTAPFSRRTFLKRTTAVGLSALMANSLRRAVAHAADDLPCNTHGAPVRGQDIVTKDPLAEARFGFMFKRLPAFTPDPSQLTTLGLAMVETSDAARDNPLIPAGYTFLGQFIDHDITLDTTPLSQQQADPYATTNYRTPRFDLDSIYGRGPAYDTWLYGLNGDTAKIAYGPNRCSVNDVPRSTMLVDAQGNPVDKPYMIECRNDENALVLQIHLALIRFHNAIVDYVRRQPGVQPNYVFETARRITRWHYQWMVIHDFLPRIAGSNAVAAVYKDGGTGQPPTINLSFYNPSNRTNLPFMPVEFAVAAYRFGHSMARPKYTPHDPDVFLPLFDATATERFDDGGVKDLRGGRALRPELEVKDWSILFDKLPTPGNRQDLPRHARLIDTQLSPPLQNLPTSVVPPDPPPPGIYENRLAVRNVLRGRSLGLPSGQTIAKTMSKKLPGIKVLSNAQLQYPILGGTEQDSVGAALASSGLTEAPLWFYILREAEILAGGQSLGPVGGRIVAETLVGLLQRDRNSYLYISPSWRPTLPDRDGKVGEQFRMIDLLTFAGLA